MKDVEIVPLFDRVLLKNEDEKVSENGIYVPRDSKEKSKIMTVVSAGNGILDDGTDVKMTVNTGDKVLVCKYAGTEIIHGNDKLWILKQCDILAKIQKQDGKNNKENVRK